MSDFDLIDRAKHSVLNRHLCRCGWQGDDIITHVIDLLALEQVAPFDKAPHAHGCWYRAGGPCDCTLKHSKLYRLGGGQRWMTDRKGQWLIDGAERARQRLEALPATSLGPAARVLLGIKDVPCPTCKGRGTITIDPRAERGATDVADTPDSATTDAIGAL